MSVLFLYLKTGWRPKVEGVLEMDVNAGLINDGFDNLRRLIQCAWGELAMAAQMSREVPHTLDIVMHGAKSNLSLEKGLVEDGTKKAEYAKAMLSNLEGFLRDFEI